MNYTDGVLKFGVKCPNSYSWIVNRGGCFMNYTDGSG